MLRRLIFVTVSSAALFASLAQANSNTFTVQTASGSFQGPAPSGLSLPAGDNSFSASFTAGSCNSNVLPVTITFCGAPGTTSQGSALGKFVFSDSAATASTYYGPIDLNMSVTVGSSSTTLSFVGSLTESANKLYVTYTPQANQFTETLWDSAANVSGLYIAQYFDGYQFGVLESTLAASSEIDSKQVGIDGVVGAAPEPATVFPLSLAGLGLIALGFKKRAQKQP